MAKTTPVAVYVDDALVGEGEISYNDMSYSYPSILIIHHCDETPLYVDDKEASLLLCWDDMVSHYLQGTVEKELQLPVYVGDVFVGEARIKVSDSYSSGLIPFLLYMAMLLLTMYIISEAVSEALE